MIFHNVTQLCVTVSSSKVIVYILAHTRQCANEVVFKWCFLRRLYSVQTNLSSLFCDFGQIWGTIFGLLIKAPKTVWKWRRLYSTWAILSRTLSNFPKFVLEAAVSGKLERVRFNFGRFGQIILDTPRSCPAPGNYFVLGHRVCPKVVDSMVIWAYNTFIN